MAPTLRSTSILALVLVCGTLSACAAAPDISADLARLEADAGVWFDHYNNGNADGVVALYTADAVVMPAGLPALAGETAIRDYIVADIAQAKAAGIVVNNGVVTGVGGSGDLAWVSGTFSVTDASGATIDNGKYLAVYQRTDDGWKMIRDTWNSDIAPAAAAEPVAAQ